MSLSILCVTRLEPHAALFLSAMGTVASRVGAEFVLAVDGEAPERGFPDADRVGYVHSKGYLESVLEDALTLCRGDWVLRLDDDERCSPMLANWLSTRQYVAHDHWKFPRAHFWPDECSVMMTPHLWPDHQTRLSVRGKAGGRTTVHAGSPFGGGEEAPVYLEHHKFLARSHAERLVIAMRYDRQIPGAGTGGMRPFSLPEDVYDKVKVVERGSGIVPWAPRWVKELAIGAVIA